VRSQNVKIATLYYAVDGTKEPFEVKFSAADFEGVPVKGSITAQGHLMRVEEGVMMLISHLKATQEVNCSYCGRTLKLPVRFEPSEWLFYEKKPLEYDDENEYLYLDKKQMTVDPIEPIRQELILNLETAPRCAKVCTKFEEPEPGVKALSHLKKLIK